MVPETKNARIESTMLGREDHGILTFMLHLSYGGSGHGGSCVYPPSRCAAPEPLPCPWCGSLGRLHKPTPPWSWSVSCPNLACGARPHVLGSTEEEALGRWNTRSPVRTEPGEEARVVARALVELWSAWQEPPAPERTP